MRVIELFAGVGGFRVGLNKSSKDFKFVWANQWEPGTKTQHAFSIYEKNFGKNSCINQDISKIDKQFIPEHDLLTTGFPCQDYSVAKSLKYSGGIEGKKGVLWWQIIDIIDIKKPKFLLLENVDRLLSSPSKQKGRDFAIILKTLYDRGYYIEWRVINAAEYGFPQKRKRTFIFAALKTSELYQEIKLDFIKNSLFNQQFPMDIISNSKEFLLSQDLLEISETFGKDVKKSFFENAGYVDTSITTYKTISTYSGEKIVLKNILEKEEDVKPEFWINENDIKKWEPFKLGRKIERIDKKTGFKYIYAEGRMSFPDDLNKPARTIITGEGGVAASRFKHVIKQNGKFRRLMPIELERINMFPDNHTQSVTDVKRAFLMGNALVTGVIARIGEFLISKN